MRRIRSLMVVSICGALVGSLSSAMGQPSVVPRAGQPAVQVQVGPGQRAQQPHGDQTLASCVAIDNQEEVAIGKFAKDKAHDQQVKDFAAMIVKDHQAFLQKLQKFAPEAASDGYLTEAPATAKRPGKPTDENPKTSATGIQQVGGTVATHATGSLDFVQLHREMAQECLKESKQQLSKKSGHEFDECFIGFQIAKHAAMKNKLTVFQRHTSGELSQLLADGAEATQKHMDKAEEIMKNLAHSSSSDSKQSREKKSSDDSNKKSTD